MAHANLMSRIVCMSTLVAVTQMAGLAAAEEGPMRVYIGTYTGPESKGIYLSQLDTATGALSRAELAAEVANPSFLAIHPNRKSGYSVNQVADSPGKPP